MPCWIPQPVSCHWPEAASTVSKCSWRWTQKASETRRAILQLQINILPSCITLVLLYICTIYCWKTSVCLKHWNIAGTLSSVDLFLRASSFAVFLHSSWIWLARVPVTQPYFWTLFLHISFGYGHYATPREPLAFCGHVLYTCNSDTFLFSSRCKILYAEHHDKNRLLMSLFKLGTTLP